MRGETDQLRPQILDHRQAAAFVSQVGILAALEGVFAANLEEAGGLQKFVFIAVIDVQESKCTYKDILFLDTMLDNALVV
jgi:hypothetical protein